MHPSLLSYVVADRQQRLREEARAHHRTLELRIARERRRWRLRSPIVRLPIPAPVRTAAPERAQASLGLACP